MLGFSSALLFSLALGVSVINSVLVIFMSYRLFLIFQQGGYRVRPFIAWCLDGRSRLFGRLFSLALVSFGLMVISNVLSYLHLENYYVPIVGIVFYIGFASVLVWDAFRQTKKVPLRLTPRLVRLGIITALLAFGTSFFLLWFGSTIVNGWIIGFSFIALTALMLPEFILGAHYILYPYEALVRRYFIRKATKKLESETYINLIRIGITGSYGKTSVKNILATMMAKKFRTAVSPASFNTPMGFAKTINDVLKPEHEVLIMEMGLRYTFDIEYLCRLFKPQHGILTAIGTAHIETMKTQDAIKREKAKLVQAIPPQGIAILNGQSPLCGVVYKELSLENKILVKLDDVTKNVKVSESGCEFDLVLGEDVVPCKTELLGRHNIENIALCALLAYRLGVSSQQIQEAIAELKPTPHRLQLIRAENGVIILDDSYNASEQGTKAGLEVLALFSGGKKIVQTPGIVELGSHSTQVNRNFAKRIATVADEVIIINDANKQSLLDGLAEANFPTEKIHIFKTLAEAVAVYPTILKRGDVLLLANDLPDLFN